MPFQLRPQIYSLLLCASVEQNPTTHGWTVEPFSAISVKKMPVDLTLTVFAQIMAPPGNYQLVLEFFHSADPENSAQRLTPIAVRVQEGKNLDFVLHIETQITQLGLHVLSAQLDGASPAYTPLRIVLAQ